MWYVLKHSDKNGLVEVNEALYKSSMSAVLLDYC